MSQRKANKRTVEIILVGAAILVGVVAWWHSKGEGEDNNLVSGNGRIEAVEIDIAARQPGRIEEILVKEGEFVTQGQKLVLMDTRVMEAQLRQEEARSHQSESAVFTAKSQLQLREAEKLAAEALLTQRESELEIAAKRLARSSTLAKEGSSAQQEVDDDTASVKIAEASVRAAKAQIASAEAAISAATAEIRGAESAVLAAKASVERIEQEISDAVLVAPRAGRVQYLIAQTGEVVGSGARILNMLDFEDVYMTFFLPTEIVGKIAIGAEVRLVMDAAPDRVVPAAISFVSDVAQFTPKTVETKIERQKLMFRVKARVSQELLQKYIKQVKTGLPGMAYLRVDEERPWPAFLQEGLVE